MVDVKQPLISVDSVVCRLVGTGIEILLAERWNEPYAGEWGLPGVLLQANESLAEAARRALLDKTEIPEENVRGIFQLGAFDETNRDPRGSTISMACWAFVDPETPTTGQWVNVDNLAELPFDHNLIIERAVSLLENPVEELVKGILGNFFSSGDYALLVESAGATIDRTNLTRIIPSRLPHVSKAGKAPSRISRKNSQHWTFSS